MGNRIWIARGCLAVILAIAFAFVPAFRWLDRDEQRARERMENELHGKRERIAELRLENAELRRQVDALKGDRRAVERLARDDLGLLYPGEIRVLMGGGARE